MSDSHFHLKQLTWFIPKAQKTVHYLSALLLSVMITGLFTLQAKADEDELEILEYIAVPEAENLEQDAKFRDETGMAIMVYVSAPDCPYCVRLEEEVILPLLRSGDYSNKLILRNINWDSSLPVIDFDGIAKEPGDLLLKYNIIATPTLLFLNSDGTEASKRITGYQGDDFFWYYLDRAIERSLL